MGDLISLFDAANVSVRLASKVGEAGNVHGDVRPAVGIGKEIREATPGILEAEFVDLIVAKCPCVLEDAGRVAISLLRSARIVILPEGLILSVDCDSSH